MKKSFPLILVAVLFFAVQFQVNSQEYELQRSAVGSGGSVNLLNTVDSTSLYCLVGQVAIFSLTNGGTDILHQGFWVPWHDSLPDDVDDYSISLSDHLGNYPNPFNSFTTIKYTLPGNSYVMLKIFDNVGRMKKLLVREVQSQGQHEIIWDGKDDNGIDCASGSYIYELYARPSQTAGFGSSNEINLRNMMVIVR